MHDTNAKAVPISRARKKPRTLDEIVAHGKVVLEGYKQRTKDTEDPEHFYSGVPETNASDMPEKNKYNEQLSEIEKNI